jgi:hypothetical protein
LTGARPAVGRRRRGIDLPGFDRAARTYEAVGRTRWAVLAAPVVVVPWVPPLVVVELPVVPPPVVAPPLVVVLVGMVLPQAAKANEATKAKAVFMNGSLTKLAAIPGKLLPDCSKCQAVLSLLWSILAK